MEFTQISTYKIIRLIGEGSFGKVYKAKENGKSFALKIELKDISENSQLKNEYLIYRKLKNKRGIPNIHYFGEFQNHYFIVIDLLKINLQRKFEMYNKIFSLETVLKLGIELFSIIEEIHEAGYILRDFKPENVMLNDNKVYLIDFGMAKPYIIDGEHILFNNNKRLTGTVRYASINTHMGFEQSRRDDLETILYSLIYFAKGSLPWIGTKGKTHEEKFELIGLKKKNITPSNLCSTIPDKRPFVRSLSYVQNLTFTENPDYEKIRRYFTTSLNRLNGEESREDLFSEKDTGCIWNMFSCI